MSNKTRRNVIPNVPVNVDPNMRQFLEAVRETMQVTAGQRGNKLDSAVTFRDLEGKFGVTMQAIRALRDEVGRPDPSNDPLGAPTGLGVAYAFDTALVFWDFPYMTGYAYSEVFRIGIEVINGVMPAEPAFSEDYLIATVNGSRLTDKIAPDFAYFYWVRHVGTDGVVSAISGPVFALGSDLPSKIVDEVLGQLPSDPFIQELQQRIEDIDLTPLELADQQLQSALAAIELYAGQIDQALQDADLRLTNANVAVSQALNDADQRLSAADQLLSEALATADQRLTAADSALNSAIQSANQAIADADQRLTAADSALGSAIQSANQAIADADQRLTAADSLLDERVTLATQEIDAQKARIDDAFEDLFTVGQDIIRVDNKADGVVQSLSALYTLTPEGSLGAIKSFEQVYGTTATRIGTLESLTKKDDGPIGSRITSIEEAAESGASVADEIEAFNGNGSSSITSYLQTTADTASRLEKLGTYSDTDGFSEISGLKTTQTNQASAIEKLVVKNPDGTFGSIKSFEQVYGTTATRIGTLESLTKDGDGPIGSRINSIEEAAEAGASVADEIKAFNGNGSSSITGFLETTAETASKLEKLGTYSDTDGFSEISGLKTTQTNQANAIEKLVVKNPDGSFGSIKNFEQVYGTTATRIGTLESLTKKDDGPIGSRITSIEEAAEAGASVADEIKAFNGNGSSSITSHLETTAETASRLEKLGTYSDTDGFSEISGLKTTQTDHASALSKLVSQKPDGSFGAIKNFSLVYSDVATQITTLENLTRMDGGDIGSRINAIEDSAGDSATKLESLGSYDSVNKRFATIAELQTTTSNQATRLTELGFKTGSEVNAHWRWEYTLSSTGQTAAALTDPRIATDSRGVIVTMTNTGILGLYSASLYSVDPTRTYEVSGTAQVLTNGASASVAVGFIMLSSAFENLNGGSWRRDTRTLTNAQGAVGFRFTVTGQSSTTGTGPRDFYTGTAYVRPYFRIENAANIQVLLQNLRIRDITDRVTIDNKFTNLLEVDAQGVSNISRLTSELKGDESSVGSRITNIETAATSGATFVQQLKNYDSSWNSNIQNFFKASKDGATALTTLNNGNGSANSKYSELVGLANTTATRLSSLGSYTDDKFSVIRNLEVADSNLAQSIRTVEFSIADARRYDRKESYSTAATGEKATVLTDTTTWVTELPGGGVIIDGHPTNTSSRYVYTAVAYPVNTSRRYKVIGYATVLQDRTPVSGELDPLVEMAVYPLNANFGYVDGSRRRRVPTTTAISSFNRRATSASGRIRFEAIFTGENASTSGNRVDFQTGTKFIKLDLRVINAPGAKVLFEGVEIRDVTDVVDVNNRFSEYLRADAEIVSRLTTLESATRGTDGSAGGRIDTLETAANTGAIFVQQLKNYDSSWNSNIQNFFKASKDGATALTTLSNGNGSANSKYSELVGLANTTATRLSSLGSYTDDKFSVIRNLETADANQAISLQQLRFSIGEGLSASKLADLSLQFAGETVSSVDNANVTMVDGRIRIVGDRWLYSVRAFRIDPTRSYRVRFIVRQLTNPTPANARVYAGVTCLTSTFTEAASGYNRNRYCAANNVNITVEQGKLTFEGDITGIGSTSNTFVANTVWVRPMFIVNYQGGTGTVEVESIELRDMTESASVEDRARAYIDEETGALKAQRVLKVDADGVVASMGLDATSGGESRLNFVADQMNFVTTTGGTALGALSVRDGTLVFEKAIAKDIDVENLKAVNATVIKFRAAEDVELPFGVISQDNLEPEFLRRLVMVDDPDAEATGGTTTITRVLKFTGTNAERGYGTFLTSSISGGGNNTEVTLTFTGNDSKSGSAFAQGLPPLFAAPKIRFKLRRGSTLLTIPAETITLINNAAGSSGSKIADLGANTYEVTGYAYNHTQEVAGGGVYAFTRNCNVNFRLNFVAGRFSNASNYSIEIVQTSGGSNDLTANGNLNVFEPTGSTGGLVVNTSWDAIAGKPQTATRWPAFSEVTGTAAAAQIPNLNASKITAGTFAAARIPTGISITGNAGTVTNGVYTNGSYANPAWITSLEASKLTGTIANARISGSYTGLVNLTGSGNVDFAKFLGNASDTASAPSYSWTGDTNTGMWRPGADQIGFATAGSNRLTITNTEAAFSVPIVVNRSLDLSMGENTRPNGLYVSDLGTTVGPVGNPTYTAAITVQANSARGISLTVDSSGYLYGMRLHTSAGVTGFQSRVREADGWTTDRNFTIGNSTKLVNGRSAVSWSLSEIGAAASSHTHNVTDINASGNRSGVTFLRGDGVWAAPEVNIGTTIRTTGSTNNFFGDIVLFGTDGISITEAAKSNPSGANFTFSISGIAWSKLTGVPAQATRWPSWSEVTSKPATFAPSAHTHAWGDITSGIPATATRWPSWSEVTSKPTTFTPSAHDHNRLTRDGVITYGVGKLQWADVSGAGGTGLTGSAPSNPRSDWYHHLIMNHANSTGYYVDIAACFHSDEIAFRRMNGGTLTPWRTLIHDGNINSHAPSFTGTGASGTWGISVTGTAAGISQVAAGAADSMLDSGIYSIESQSGYPSNFGSLLVARRSSGRVGQMFFGATGGITPEVHYRQSGGSPTAWSAWVRFLHSDNFNEYSPTLTGGGASGTWNISISGNAATATRLQTARTINGTSFNGSANVTTANWGTARTLTVGNTGKSVNGSANVSWSLAEIGALGNTGSQILSKAAHDANSSNSHLELNAPAGSAAGEVSLRFHQSSRFWGQIRMRSDGFHFTDGASATYRDVYALNFVGNASTVTNGVYTTGDQTIGGIKTFSSELRVSDRQLRITGGNRGVIFRNADDLLYIMVTNTGDNNGTWTSSRPFQLNTSTGQLTLGASPVLNSQAIDTNQAVRADRTLRVNVASGGGIAVTGAGTGAQNLTANRTWTLAVDSSVLRTTGDQTISGVKTFNGRGVFQHSSSATNPASVTMPLRVYNSAWAGNMVTGIEFWNGGNKTVPASRIVSQMAGSGADGERLLFQVQQPDASNPNQTQPITRMVINNNGNVGIGIDAPTARLHVNGGDFLCSGNVSAYSDIRLKKNVRLIDRALEKVNAVRGVTFDRTDSDIRQAGVIAQEIEAVLPEVVATDDKGMKSVAYGNLVALLIEAVKELAAKVEYLERGTA